MNMCFRETQTIMNVCLVWGAWLWYVFVVLGGFWFWCGFLMWWGAVTSTWRVQVARLWLGPNQPKTKTTNHKSNLVRAALVLRLKEFLNSSRQICFFVFGVRWFVVCCDGVGSYRQTHRDYLILNKSARQDLTPPPSYTRKWCLVVLLLLSRAV